MDIEDYKKIINILIKERDCWKEAWFQQCDATGKNYWDGFRDGFQCGKDVTPKYGFK